MNPAPDSRRIAAIEVALREAFEPSELRIEDESHLHAGHAGARSGKGHFRVSIVSNAFEGMSLIARHRAVYAALDALIRSDIHALSIDARPPAG